MIRLWSILAILVLGISVALHGAARAGEFEFVGFTNEATNVEADTIDGNESMIAMHVLCQDDFGPDSRMCTSEEFWLSPNAKAPSADAWYHSARESP